MTKKHQTAPDPSIEEFEAITEQLTVDQLRFVVARQEHSTDKEAAKAIGISPETVKNWKYGGAPIDAAVRMMAFDGLIVAAKMRRKSLAKAMAVKVKGLESKDDRLRQGVATEIIEWEMGKAAGRTELTGPDGGPIETKDTTIGATERNRAVATLAEFITAGVSAGSEGRDSTVGTPERPAMDGAAESSG